MRTDDSSEILINVDLPGVLGYRETPWLISKRGYQQEEIPGWWLKRYASEIYWDLGFYPWRLEIKINVAIGKKLKTFNTHYIVEWELQLPWICSGDLIWNESSLMVTNNSKYKIILRHLRNSKCLKESFITFVTIVKSFFFKKWGYLCINLFICYCFDNIVLGMLHYDILECRLKNLKWSVLYCRTDIFIVENLENDVKQRENF